jgi:hypothetical protein
MPSTPPKTGSSPPTPSGRRTGQTTPAKDAAVVPQQPNDRDESSASQQGAPSDVMRQAQRDVERGLVDTSRAEATDATYAHNLRDGGPASAPGETTPNPAKKR